MAFVIADRVRETTISTGTGSVTLAGAYTSFQTFATAIGNGNNTYYTIASATSGEWEVGIGTYATTGNLLSRDTVLASSAGGAKVSFSGGSKDVFVTQPSERSLLINAASNGLFAGNAAFTANGVLYANSTTTVTTGSALQFDGSGLSIGNVAAANTRITVRTAAQTDAAFAADNGVNTGFRVQFASNLTSIGNDFNNPLAFLQNNTEQMRLTSTGLGIGTSSPDAKLDVTSAGSAAAYTVSAVIQDGTYPASGNPTLEFNGFIGGNGYRSGIGSIGGQQLAFYTPSTFGVAPTRHMTLTELGNLGIGTSSPAGKLDVTGANGAGAINAYIRGGSTAGDYGILNFANGSTIRGRLVADASSDTFRFDTSGGASTAITFLTGSSYTERMRLDSSGNLGIGTSSPGAKLDVNGGTNSEMRLTTSGSGYLQVGQFTNGAFIGTSSTDATAGILRLGTGGTTRATLDSSGNLGLGVTPSASQANGVLFLKNNGQIAFSGPVSYFDTNIVYNSGADRYIANGTASRIAQLGGSFQFLTAPSGNANDTISFTQAMTLDASGNLGIGTTGPQDKLDVVSGSSAFLNRVRNTGANQAAFLFQNSTTGTLPTDGLFVGIGADTVGYVYQYENQPLVFGTNNTERARIDSSGNLLVGTTSSDGSRLRVYGSYQTLGDGAYEGLIGKASSLVSGGGSGDFAIRSAANLVFATNGNTERARIDSSGNLLVGTTSGSNKLSVTTSGTSLAALVGAEYSQVNIIGGSQNFYIQNYNSVSIIGTKGASPLLFTTNEIERARIYADGQLQVSSALAGSNLLSFINSSATGYGISMTVNNDSSGTYRYFEGYSSSAAAQRIAIYTNGDVKNTNGVFAAFSDVKLKKDIVDAGSQWDDIKALRVRKYKLKNDASDVVQIGLIAQEVEQVSPGLVDESQDEIRDEDGKIVLTGEVTKGVKYSILYMKAVKALQEAMARIETLEAKVAQLEGTQP